eukprot:Hpha_TRINITY_DN28632_c0_g1::TRINITY_DN28632_c0_g1_i1::g.156429::m.156429
MGGGGSQPQKCTGSTLLTITHAVLSSRYLGSTECGAERCIDGVKNNACAANCCLYNEDICYSGGNASDKVNPWLMLDLGLPTTVDCIQIYNRKTDSELLGHSVVYVGENETHPLGLGNILCYENNQTTPQEMSHQLNNCPGRFVFIYLPG